MSNRTEYQLIGDFVNFLHDKETLCCKWCVANLVSSAEYLKASIDYLVREADKAYGDKESLLG